MGARIPGVFVEGGAVTDREKMLEVARQILPLMAQLRSAVEEVAGKSTWTLENEGGIVQHGITVGHGCKCAGDGIAIGGPRAQAAPGMVVVDVAWLKRALEMTR